MDRYELHVGGRKIIGSLKEIEVVIKSITDPYEVYMVKESMLYYVDLRKEGSGRREKLSKEDKENCVRLYDRGYTTNLICKKYHISMDTLDKVLHPEKSKKHVGNI